MSIIHDALKKAELERGPMSPRLPFYGASRAAHRRWKRVVTASLLVSTTMLGMFGAWTWWSRGLSPLIMIPLPMAPMSEPKLADSTSAHSVARGSTDVARTPEDVSRTQRDEASSTPVSEPDQSGESAFTKAREAEAGGQWDQAIYYYRQAIDLNSLLLEARNNLGNLLIHQRQIAAAIQELRAALAIDPDYVLARNNLGSAYLLNGEEGQAIQEFLAAVHIDRAYVSPYYNLALLYARRGDVEQSMGFLIRALAIEPAVLSWVQEEPDFASIRGAPAFQRLRAQNQARR
jgi:tetratricopeptide (TPR) repeat protein